MRPLTLVLPLFRQRPSPRRRVPSGLLCLAAEASRIPNVDVEIVDAEAAAWTVTETADMVAAHDPAAIGVSICSPAYSSALEVVRALRARLPDATLVLGGKHVTHNWQAVAHDCADADAIVRGDGESAI
jgi:radical SAM superfamily enzyme YgiQ (UPF0313 family)